MLRTSRDVYGKHYYDLTPKELKRLPEFIALTMIDGHSGKLSL